MMAASILLIEDDPRIVSFLQRGLAAEGYRVQVASDEIQAIKLIAAHEFPLIILDRMLPGTDGLQICENFRKTGTRSRILMLTAKDTVQDKIDGLKAGADDYLTKPFAFAELVARVEALLRRPDQVKTEKILEVADLRVDLLAKTVQRGDRKIALTAREFALLACLMSDAGKPFSRQQLLNSVWNFNFDTGTNVVEVYIRYLGRKIDDGQSEPLIHNVRGFGYMIGPQSAAR